MIVYDLRCANGHIFEEWFNSAAEYEGKVAAANLECPRCGDTAVIKALTAPRINGGSSSALETPCGRESCGMTGCQMADRS
jgi:hypothetical protein